MKQLYADNNEQLSFVLGSLVGDYRNLLQILIRKNDIEEAMAVSNTIDEIIADATKLLPTASLESKQYLEFIRNSCEERQKQAKKEYRKTQRKNMK